MPMDELGEDGPPQRKRVSKACDRCRRRKDKCDGKKPICGTCEQSSAVCSWNPLSKKRGLPDGYVRGLEKICGAIIREIPGVEDLLLSKFTADEDALYDYWADDANSDSPLELWKKSRLVKELDRFLPVLDSLTKKGKKRTWEESEGLPTTQNVVPSPRLIPAGATIPAIKEDEIITAVPPEPKVIEPSDTDIGPLPSICHSGSPNDWVLPPSAGRLVEAYFSYTHMWLPIVERHDLLRVLYQGPKSKVTRSPGENAALWAVLAYAQAHYSIISSTIDPQSSDSSADLFYDRAKSLLPVIDGDYELGHVQAMLILSVLKVGQQDWKSAWILVGHAVRIAMNLGLDLIPPNAEQSRLPNGERRRKHVFLGCFVLDTIVAARLGRHPHLRSQEAEGVGTLDEEGLEEWDHWNDSLGIRRTSISSPYQATTLSTFNKLVQLLRILNDILCFNAPRKPHTVVPDFGSRHNSANNEMNIFYNGIASQLDTWKSSHSSAEENLSLPSHCNLYLTYLSIIMAVNLRSTSNTPSIYAGQNTMQWLKLYADKFGLLVLPPIFEYSLKLAGDCITHSLNGHGLESFNDMNWIETWHQVTLALSRSWPVFQLSNSLPRCNSMNVKPLLKTGIPMNSRLEFTNTTTPLGQATAIQDYWQSTPRVFIETTPHSFHSPAVVQQQSQSSQSQAQFQSRRMAESLDQDSIFNEFDAMDANLWSNTWEQSLLNLGFTNDMQNIDEEFYSFFGNDPKSTEGSFNLFDQPLGNAQAKTGGNGIDQVAQFEGSKKSL